MRKDYRRHHNRAAELGIEVKYHPIEDAMDKAILDNAMTLIRNVENHHGSSHNPWARAMLEHAHMVDSHWVTARTNDTLVGCGLLLGDEHAYEMRLLGLDYGVRYAYFQVLYAALKCAIEQGIQTLDGGSGAYEMKQRLGFQIEDNNHVIFSGRGPVLSLLGRWIA